MKKMNRTLAAVCVIGALSAGGSAIAGDVAYKCGSNSYAQQACSDEVVNTDEYRARPASKSATVAPRRLPGESDAQFALRSRRAGLSPTDQDECKRLDTKIPFEQERLKKAAEAEEVVEAKQSLEAARRRFGHLGC